MSPSPLPPADIPDDDPSSPTSYFTLEARRQNRETLGGEPLPAQPASSPWAPDPVGPEPPIDRRDDGDFFQPEDFFQPTPEGDDA
jgi:hypothetical protein